MTIDEAKAKIQQAEQAIEALIRGLESDGLTVKNVEVNKRLILPGQSPQCNYAIKIKVEI